MCPLVSLPISLWIDSGCPSATCLSFCKGPMCYLFQIHTELCLECQPHAYFWKVKIQSLRLPLQLSLPHSLELNEFRNRYLSSCSKDKIKHKIKELTCIIKCQAEGEGGRAGKGDALDFFRARKCLIL